jgi:hypothetical protein
MKFVPSAGEILPMVVVVVGVLFILKMVPSAKAIIAG